MCAASAWGPPVGGGVALHLQGVPEGVERQTLVVDEVLLCAWYHVRVVVEGDAHRLAVGHVSLVAVASTVGSGGGVPVALHGHSLQAVASGPELGGVEMECVAVVGKGADAAVFDTERSATF